MTPSWQLHISFTPTNSTPSLKSLTTTFTDILSRMNLNKLLLNPSQNNNVSNFLNLQTYLSAMISSQSVPLLAILHAFIVDSDMSFSDQIDSVSKF